MTSSGKPSDFEYKSFRKDWDQLLERQQYKEAEKLCHDGLAKSPLDQSRGRLYNHLGYLYENFLDDKTFDDILEHYVLSLQVDESNANSHYNLANFLLEQGMQHLLRALELNPQHGKANKRYANLTPIKNGTTLDLGGHKYQVVEVVEDGVRADRLRKRDDGGYEKVGDDSVYVEVSPPEKVHATSSSTNQGRAANPGAASSGRQPLPLSIDDPNNNSSAASTSGTCGCCFKCVLQWWLWALLWILAIGGVTLPVLGYFDLLSETECEDKLTAETVALNSDTATQGQLNALFVVDCATDNFDAQFTSANALLSELEDGGVDVSYDIVQYCGSAYSGNASAEFAAYTSQSGPDANDFEQNTAGAELDPQFTGALSACLDVYAAIDDSDSTPFLCVPFISHDFDDSFEAMTLAAGTDFADIYLSPFVDESGAMWDNSAYAVLGALATQTECLARTESEDALGNSWWAARLNCDSATSQHEYCPHCVEADGVACAGEELARVFGGEGVTETQIISSETECAHSFEAYFFYSIGGVVPLIAWVALVMMVLCCRSCVTIERNLEEHNALGHHDEAQQSQAQSAFV